MNASVVQQRALANQERLAQSHRLNRMARSIIMLVATLLSFATVGLLAADQLYRPDTFVIDQLKIKGSFRYLKPQQVEAVVKQEAIGNFFSIELDEIRQRIENMPWVQFAEVRREWPNSLLIDVQEQRPVMQWQKDRWVNSSGEVIELPEQVSLPNPIRLSGNEKDSQEMLQQAYRWQQQLSSRDLQLLGLALSESHAYTLDLAYSNSGSNFKLLLGRDDVSQRLARFLMLFDHQYRYSNERLLSVDARYPDGLAIRSELIESIEIRSGGIRSGGIRSKDISESDIETLALNKPNRLRNR